MKVKKNFRIAIMASGNGTNAGEIMRFFSSHQHINVGSVITNNPNAYVLERAKKFSVPTQIFNREDWKNTDILLKILQNNSITHIVLAGFLWLVPTGLIDAYPGRIVNIHPALLPDFGGNGMYGEKVHSAVKNSGKNVTGISIHLVTEKFDEGPVIFQAKCDVYPTDTPHDIGERVHKLEYEYYPKVIEKWILGQKIEF